MDDDVVILDGLDDALDAFTHNDIVFTPDQDLGGAYTSTWAHRRDPNQPWPLPTARFNAGLYWLRPVHDRRQLAAQMLVARPRPENAVGWEQGFIALAYARQRVLQLPNQRYLFPIFDGLPGGLLGYDYFGNPCGFASVHFGGLAEKPSDGAALELLEPILGRCPDSAAASAKHASVALLSSV